MNRFSVAIRIWLLSLAVCSVAVVLSFLWFDTTIAAYCAQFSHHLRGLGEGLGSAIILALETLTVIALVLARLIRGKLSPSAEALAMACLASICAYGIDSSVLKLYFGVPTPDTMLLGVGHSFNFWSGSPRSSFPSGHMVLAGAFAGVFMRLYRFSIVPLSIFLLFGAILLIVGDWHFLSDVIAGAFLGISAGLLAGELWKVHSRREAAKITSSSADVPQH